MLLLGLMSAVMAASCSVEEFLLIASVMLCVSTGVTAVMTLMKHALQEVHLSDTIHQTSLDVYSMRVAYLA